jgi:1,4-alpha-glucan branching enzyme
MRTQIYGGRENLDTISFLKEFNEAVYSNFEGPNRRKYFVSYGFKNKSIGGLGFGMKWMMGWMHTEYFQKTL